MKLTEHYERTVLTLAVLTALGLGTSIGVNAGKVERDFQAVRVAPAGIPVPKDAVRIAAQSREEPLPPGGGAATLFTGPTEYLIKGTERVVDLSDPAAPPVHPPIPNQWWLQHKIDPGFADSPQRDADRDGFSNLEEFQAGSNPADFGSHPPLIAKLRVGMLEERKIRLNYSAHDCTGVPQAKDRFGFRYADSTGARNSVTAEIPAGRGAASTFFAKPPAQLRFELKDVALIGETYTATLIDRKPNKDGRQYQIEKGARNAIFISDFTATLILDALGRGGTPLEVEESGSFGLPFDAQPANHVYRFKEVRQGGQGLEVVIEGNEAGGRKEYVLPVPGK